MKIVMLGAGALGSTIGGTLAMGGNDVHFVDMWQEHVDLINKDGLHMTNEKEDWYVRVDARTTADTIGEADLVIVLVKSFATKQAVEQLKQTNVIGKTPWSCPYKTVWAMKKRLLLSSALKMSSAARHMLAAD